MSVRRSYKLLAMGTLLLVGIALLSGCVPVPAATASAAAPQLQESSLPRTITVVGRGEVQAEPDIATINLGVDVTGATVAEAMTEAETRMEAILAALANLGIAQEDIQTSNFSITFERLSPDVRTMAAPEPAAESAPTSSEGTQAPTGIYHVSNMVQVRIRDLDSAGDVLDAAVEAGVNNVWGISFGLDDTTALEAEAREEAIADARARAEELARLNGVSVGDVLSISEVITGGQIPLPAAEAFGRGGGGGVSIEPGQLDFTTQIQVIYEIQ